MLTWCDLYKFAGKIRLNCQIYVEARASLHPLGYAPVIINSDCVFSCSWRYRVGWFLQDLGRLDTYRYHTLLISPWVTMLRVIKRFTCSSSIVPHQIRVLVQCDRHVSRQSASDPGCFVPSSLFTLKTRDIVRHETPPPPPAKKKKQKKKKKKNSCTGSQTGMTDSL